MIKKQRKLKGFDVNKIAWILLAMMLGLTGCQNEKTSQNTKTIQDSGTLFALSFTKDRKSTYNFLSKRDVYIDWQNQTKPKGKTKTDHIEESLKTTVEYVITEAEFGQPAKIKATCISAKVSRNSKTNRKVTNKDAANKLTGKSFGFTVEPTGEIIDHDELAQVLLTTGKNAFRTIKGSGRIKDPEMLGDFTVTQHFLWDWLASFKNYQQGIKIGQTWQSQLSAPSPVTIIIARNVTYKLDKIETNQANEKMATITTVYSKADPIKIKWPQPHTGSFSASGIFGFLRGYKVTNLKGTGKIMFNVTTGQTISSVENYQIKIDAVFPMGLNMKPKITVNQTIESHLVLPKKVR